MTVFGLCFTLCAWTQGHVVMWSRRAYAVFNGGINQWVGCLLADAPGLVCYCLCSKNYSEMLDVILPTSLRNSEAFMTLCDVVKVPLLHVNGKLSLKPTEAIENSSCIVLLTHACTESDDPLASLETGN